MSEEFIDDETYPPKASAGAWNAYYINGCEVVGYRPSYCVCLNKIMAYERDGKLAGDCEGPIRVKACPALSMRKEEAEAGKAIYFSNREKLRAFTQRQQDEAKERSEILSIRKKAVGEKRDHAGMRDTEYHPPQQHVEPKKSQPVREEQDGYAAAINRAVAQASAETPVKAVAEEKLPEITSPADARALGGSMLEMARRMMSNQT